MMLLRLMLDNAAPLPLYAQIVDALAQAIARGELPPTSKLPPEESLMERFSVSRTTVRSAVQSLLQRGLVEIRRGKGTYVVRPELVQELTSLTGFVEDMDAIGLRASARLLEQKVVPADATIARHLDLEKGVEVVRFRRLRLADGAPISMDETYLPLELGARVMTEDLSKEPIFALLETKYRTPLVEADYKLAAVAASGPVAKALQVEKGAPIFLIERTSFTLDRRPVDYERLFYRGDSVRFSTRLARRAQAHPGEGRP